MPDVFPVDYTSAVGRVRKYIPDVLQLPDPKDPYAAPTYMWSDASIQSFLDDETPPNVTVIPRSTIWRAAADIMIATASNEALILKKLVTDDLATDGPAVAKALLQASEALRARASADEKSDDEVFLIVPYGSYSSDTFEIRSIWGL